MGWCGDDRAVSALGRLYTDSATTDFVRRISAEALLKLSDDATRAEFKASVIENLPRELRVLAQSGPADAFTRALRGYLDAGDHSR